MTVKKLMAANIKTARKKQHITQANLAELIGSSASYIGEIEICRKFPSPSNIEKIADALNLKPFELFFDGNIINEKQLLLPKVKEELVDIIEDKIKSIVSEYMKN